MTRARAAIILAAGQGTRMKSPLPKVLHPVGQRAMLDHAIDAAQGLGCERIVVVVGNHSPEVRAHVEKRLGPDAVAVQDPPLGTGHAVRAAEPALAGFDGDVVVTYGDVPLLTAADIAPVFGAEGVTVIGFQARDPGAYGRLVIEGDTLVAITEAKEATAEVLAITACNSGVMAAPSAVLFPLLAQVTNENAKGEYYLTDVVELARKAGHPTRAVFADEDAVMGVNAQAELAQAEALFQKVQRETFLAAGVTMSAPDTVHFAWDTQVGGGAVIEPFVVFGPGAIIDGGARIRSFSHIEGARVASGAEVGPYARLRPGADLAEGVKVGNFVEVKNVTMDKGAKANHLAYLGDGAVGAGANIGAGTIFCNYDGFNKARTQIGAGAFVGSNSSLVAPVVIGAGALIASGSVITEDVPADALAFGRARQTLKPGAAAIFREQAQAKKDAKSK
ncbi:bifunctional UDP-N-acetylglucosamine diphosphorylase/glucosamine-1-phosphate N-acetyltransferase GlmU [Brevundimonas sp.]|uniref:bifunctional UDP-N-acetylglucosamine diphosphorylase/glucosamine-1-phosphate N-acetyltransferase GlmU n=1 Tax=Brevundimonas sp. TaxID=1871086 RepID=UPI0019A788EE|nr:bifunctional UDP-N-acetylglucosamine diphosphorylase/glucosamine-1-phosphate N-acetyltransferase GlmU [Brevundimonas sp.]MBD3837969.1 bifunctional UDP-N-acetylglucosamine diphosphorylase/glucosamine-1-phosphate N-acetyltransferase GlmU [Brevundimonas sp.]